MPPSPSSLINPGKQSAFPLEDQYRLIADAIPQIVWTATPDGYNDYFNRRWFEYTGLTEEETYHTNKDAVHPDDVLRYQRSWEQAVKTGKEYEIEYRFRRAADGMYRWFLGRATPVKNAQGEIIKWLGTCTDIHDQKMAQRTVEQTNQQLENMVEERTRELREQIAARAALEDRHRTNSQRLQYVMDNMRLGALLIDEDRMILHANRRLMDLLGIPSLPEQLIGQPADAVFNHVERKQADHHHYRSTLEQILQAHEPVQNELELLDGRVLERDYVPIFVDCTLKSHLFLYRDITQEKRIDASKSEFMALASHQLRTPLTAIRWTLGKLHKMLGDHMTDAQFLVQEGRKAAARMASTIDTMLTISRIEAGKVNLMLADVHIHSFLDDLHDLLRPQLDAQDQTLQIECADGLFLLTDASLLRETVRNLITNASKYSPRGSSIIVRAEEGIEGITLRIIDHGVGIPKDQQQKVFSKFFRGSNVIETETNGSGLGLYLVLQLVKMLGGKVSFTSTENHGTTFSITLPWTTSDDLSMPSP